MSRSPMSGRQCSLYCPFVSPSMMIRCRTRSFRGGALSVRPVPLPPSGRSDAFDDLRHRGGAGVEPQRADDTLLLDDRHDALERPAVARDEAVSGLCLSAL